jgi:hypothetical protein
MINATNKKINAIALSTAFSGFIVVSGICIYLQKVSNETE